MDENKTIKLKQIDYKINESCGLCSHGLFFGKSWGECSKNAYEHRKHSKATRLLSIHQSGYCIDFLMGETDLHGFSEFLEKGS